MGADIQVAWEHVGKAVRGIQRVNGEKERCASTWRAEQGPASSPDLLQPQEAELVMKSAAGSLVRHRSAGQDVGVCWSEIEYSIYDSTDLPSL